MSRRYVRAACCTSTWVRRWPSPFSSRSTMRYGTVRLERIRFGRPCHARRRQGDMDAARTADVGAPDVRYRRSCPRCSMRTGDARLTCAVDSTRPSLRAQRPNVACWRRNCSRRRRASSRRRRSRLMRQFSLSAVFLYQRLCVVKKLLTVRALCTRLLNPILCDRLGRLQPFFVFRRR